MVEYIVNNQKLNHLMEKIIEGFPTFSLFTIPIDLSYDTISNKEENLDELNFSLSENYSLKYLDDELINRISKNIQENVYERNNDYNNIETCQEKIKNKNSLTEINNSFNELLFRNQEDKNSNCPDLKEYDKTILSENSIFQNSIKNYNINIFNPYINYVNICCPNSPSNPEVDIKENGSLNLNEKENLSGKISHVNNNEINRIVSSLSLNNNDKESNNLLINNSLNSLGDKFPLNFSNVNLEKNIFFNNNDINKILNGITNNNDKNLTENKNHDDMVPKKKNKKKKKKKVDEEYIFEMFGRRGWICEGCNNFNYESRKFCNRCKIPKAPLKKVSFLDNKGNQIINNFKNINHKDDWNCYNCGNVNYAFRLNCNRCQIKRDSFIQDTSHMKGE